MVLKCWWFFNNIDGGRFFWTWNCSFLPVLFKTRFSVFRGLEFACIFPIACADTSIDKAFPRCRFDNFFISFRILLEIYQIFLFSIFLSFLHLKNWLFSSHISDPSKPWSRLLFLPLQIVWAGEVFLDLLALTLLLATGLLPVDILRSSRLWNIVLSIPRFTASCVLLDLGVGSNPANFCIDLSSTAVNYQIN